jgi:HK97 family phage prohead protease
MEIKHGGAVEIEDKALTESDDCWTITGYASIFGNKDHGNDVVVQGAFAKSLRQFGNPILCWQHKIDDVPCGLIVEAKEDRKGLWIKAECPRDDSFVSGRLIPQIRKRGLKGMSIGYRPIVTERRKEDGARLLKEIRLYECSFVSMPMNPLAEIETIKTMSSGELTDALEQMALAARELTALARTEPVRDLADVKRAMESFIKEVKRDRPTLGTPIERAEAALRQAKARLDSYIDAVKGRR